MTNTKRVRGRGREASDPSQGRGPIFTALSPPKPPHRPAPGFAGVRGAPWATQEMGSAWSGAKNQTWDRLGAESVTWGPESGRCHRARRCHHPCCIGWYQPQGHCHCGRVFMRPEMLPQPLSLRTRVPLGAPFRHPSPLGPAPGAWGPRGASG